MCMWIYTVDYVNTVNMLHIIIYQVPDDVNVSQVFLDIGFIQLPGILPSTVAMIMSIK